MAIPPQPRFFWVEGVQVGNHKAFMVDAGSEAHFVTLIAFIGGLSAATAMVIVATIALSIMVCNDLVVPLIVRQREMTADPREDMGRLLLNIRRGAIFAQK